jgi:hypothetical protein
MRKSLNIEPFQRRFLPFQDPDWGDTTTAVTGLSDLAFPPDGMGKWGEDRLTGGGGSSDQSGGTGDSSGASFVDNWQFAMQRYMGSWTTAVFAFVAWLSPIIMVIIPRMDLVPFTERQLRCDVSCVIKLRKK